MKGVKLMTKKEMEDLQIKSIIVNKQTLPTG